MAKSKAEESLWDILCEEYSCIIIAQEPIKCGNKTLYLDYYIPSLKLAFEADGRQHNEFVAFFHRNVSGFERSQSNDALKEAWCKENKVTLIRFSAKETVDVQTLRVKIDEAVNGKTKKRRTKDQ